MSVVILFGNGLSCGFDPRLTTEALTTRVLERLGPDLAGGLDALASLASPDGRKMPRRTARHFESLAGPVDRIAEAMTAIDALLANADAEVLARLRDASADLRGLYLRIVGTVLDEVDACCIQSAAGEERRDVWTRLNDFAGKLWALGAARRTTLFTLNYDSLLFSSLLECRPPGTKLYDGFPNGALADPLNRWTSQRMALYHLHGSVAWRRDADGFVWKDRLEDVRSSGIVEAWADGRAQGGWPVVVLGDLKTRQVARAPFALFYRELRRCLDGATTVVVAGYGFGDAPVDRELARYLASSASRQVEVWRRSADPRSVLDRLRAQLGERQTIEDGQVHVRSVTLPSVEAVDELVGRQ